MANARVVMRESNVVAAEIQTGIGSEMDNVRDHARLVVFVSGW